MFNVQLEDNVAAVRRQLTNIERRQIPFALSLALNNTAFATRRFVIEKLYPRAFPHARNRAYPRTTFRVDRATKSRPEASVFDRLMRGFLEHHIEGRPKRPRGKKLAVPGRKIKRTNSGKIPNARKPRNLKNAFIADLEGRGPAVWQEFGPKSDRQLRFMYSLEDSTPVSRTFHFHREGERFARRIFPGELARAMTRALGSAR